MPLYLSPDSAGVHRMPNQERSCAAHVLGMPAMGVDPSCTRIRNAISGGRPKLHGLLRGARRGRVRLRGLADSVRSRSLTRTILPARSRRYETTGVLQD